LPASNKNLPPSRPFLPNRFARLSPTRYNQLMKIVFIGPFGLQPKGTMSVRALPLAQALVARGHTVTVLIPPWDDPARAGQQWTDGGVRIINVSLPTGLFRGPLLFHIMLTFKLVQQTLALQPQVVHLFKPKAYAGLAHLALWLRQDRTIRLVLDADDWEQAWNDILPYAPLQKWFFGWQEQWGLRHAEAVTAASRELRELIAPLRRTSAQIFYLPNGVRPQSPQADDRLPPGDSSHPPTILLYTRFAEFRLERIVTLVQRVAQVLPQARWQVVGRGFQNEEQRLVQMLAEAGLGEAVNFAGWVAAEALPNYFAAADVAVHPYDDTLLNRTKCSVKLIDLLATGLPVAADAVGQNREYIEDGVSGVLTPPEDDEALAAAIIKLLQSPDLRRKMSRAAVEKINREFTWPRLAEIAEEAYD